MKARHNKKRNTAFIYEALIKEATAALIKGQTERHNTIINLVKKHFHTSSALKQDLECYRSLYESTSLDKETGEKILREVKLSRRLLDPEGLFVQQTDLIKDVNKEISPRTFNNFVPNYKTLATINQMFNVSSPREQVILENKILGMMTASVETSEEMVPIDNLVYTAFVKKFNEKYGEDLLREQKNLLTHYIASFIDNSVELKMFLNEEIARLKEALEKAKKIQEIHEDKEMLRKTEKVITKLEGFATQTINESLLLSVLKTQRLTKEIDIHGSLG